MNFSDVNSFAGARTVHCVLVMRKSSRLKEKNNKSVDLAYTIPEDA